MGSGRIAFDYSPDLVLKLARNEKGREQNRTEADGFLQDNYKSLVANVVDSDPDDLWLVVEKAARANAADFQRTFGTSLNNLCNYIKKRISGSSFAPVENEEALSNNAAIDDLLDMMSNFQMPAGDICRISSWGKVKDRLVLVDYGLTSSIYDEYYK